MKAYKHLYDIKDADAMLDAVGSNEEEYKYPYLFGRLSGAIELFMNRVECAEDFDELRMLAHSYFDRFIEKAEQ